MNSIAVVCRKEIVDNARDRRTLASSLLFGPVLGPLLFAVLINFSVSESISSFDAPVAVPMLGADAAPELLDFLEARGITLAEQHGLANFDAAAAAVRSGREDVVVLFSSDFADEFTNPAPARISLVHDRSNSRAASRVTRVRNALTAYGQRIGALRLLARGVHPDAARPLIIDDLDVSTPAGRSVLLLGIVTYFLLLATLIGGLYLAIDTTAGERERGSLEPLLSTPVPRAQLLLGKMLATTAYMWLSLLLALAGFTIALALVPLERLGMSSGFGVGAALASIAILAPFAPLGAALMTLVASFTRSYKEAQTWLSIVLLLPTLPVVFASIMNLRPTAPLMWVPSLSQHLLITAVKRQEPLPAAMLAQSIVSTLAIGALLAWAAIRLYEREAILG